MSALPPLRLDLLAPRRPVRRWAGWLLLAAAAALAVALIEQQNSLESQLDDRVGRNELLQARQRPAARAARPQATPEDLQRIERANRVIDELAVPWGRLFQSIEAADTAGTELTLLRPDARERSLRLGGEARSMDALLAYVERLAAQPGLSHVHLVSHARPVEAATDAAAAPGPDGTASPAPSALAGTSTAGPLTFTVGATWRQP
jgi:hypothetical protein